jgi:hypothetical protein
VWQGSEVKPTALGRDPQPIHWRETWDRSRSVAAALRGATTHLQVRGAPIDRDRLRAELSGLGGSDRTAAAGTVEIGPLAWRVDAPLPAGISAASSGRRMHRR